MTQLECQICLEEFPNDIYFLSFPCDHKFCYLCCLEMFYQNQGQKCPMCRKYLTGNMLVQLPDDNLWVIQQIKHLQPTPGQKIVLNQLQKRFTQLKNHHTLSSYQLVFEKIKMLIVIGSPPEKIKMLNLVEKINKQIDYVKEPLFWVDYYNLLQEVITLLPGLKMETKLKILSWGEDNITIMCCRYNLLLNYLLDVYPDFLHKKDSSIEENDSYYYLFIEECETLYKLHRDNTWQLNNVNMDEVIYFLIKYYQRHDHPALLPILSERANFYANQNLVLYPNHSKNHFGYLLSIAIFYLYSSWESKKWSSLYLQREEYQPQKYHLDLADYYLDMAQNLFTDSPKLITELKEDNHKWYAVFNNCRGIIYYYRGMYDLSLHYLLEYKTEYAFLAFSYYHLGDILTAKYYYYQYDKFISSGTPIFQDELLDVNIDNFFDSKSFSRVLYDRRDILNSKLFPTSISRFGKSRYFMKYYVLFYIFIQLYLTTGDNIDIFWICVIGLLICICWEPKVQDANYFISNLLGWAYPQYNLALQDID